MANIFAITTPADDVKADAEGKASAVFTVTNTTGKPIRGIAKARALESTQQGWLDVEGETERDFGAHGTEQFKVIFNRPASPAPSGSAAAPVEKFPFRLDIASAANPDEDFSEGPSVHVEVQAGAPPPPPRVFPWWIILVIGGVVLLGGGVALFLVMQKSCASPPAFTGTWKMKTPPENRQFIGTLRIQQSEKGELSALVWKFGDADTGGGFAKLTGEITEGAGIMFGPLDNRGTTMKLKCKIIEEGRLSLNYSLMSPSSVPVEITQVLDRE
ncbi:MAG TPA: hypothetical protein VGO50_01445 [Pyrinomonadaceae bacterium]|jgi:hypothetical protein|nr:hypothetical protein [Pyrinomonadaceae bacterium]